MHSTGALQHSLSAVCIHLPAPGFQAVAFQHFLFLLLVPCSCCCVHREEPLQPCVHSSSCRAALGARALPPLAPCPLNIEPPSPHLSPKRLFLSIHQPQPLMPP